MTKSRGFVVLFLVLGGALCASTPAPTGPATPPPRTPTQQATEHQNKIVTRVSLVNTPVTVRDKHGQMVHTLHAKDFQLTDNGVRQQITYFGLGGDPLSVVFLVETSARIRPLMGEIQKTGIVFAETVMGLTGEAAVVGFHDSVDVLQDFSAERDVIQKSINDLTVRTNNSKLYDAMAVCVGMLSDRPQPTAAAPGQRRVLVIVSEAQDVGSKTKLGAVLRQAQLSNVTIYTVGLSTTKAEMKQPPKDVKQRIGPPGSYPLPSLPGTVQMPATEAVRNETGDLLAVTVWAVGQVKNQITEHSLELAATATGGEHIATFGDETIEKAIDDIGGELHSQYSLSYSPPSTGQMGFHEIKVIVNRKGLKVHARPGYYLAGPEN
jgi:VWFA-related protein